MSKMKKNYPAKYKAQVASAALREDTYEHGGVLGVASLALRRPPGPAL